ncbi:hypothetical protein Vadar_019068 [Vaccinium darrowii]|uniref:Uncharacterized protein n=1 Tax=Vaccinium darrowii TaxID=229202 RepID=A0ACB7XS08_9ERIC|nr:hypothetical protein Vadar_019068 [Vaccinium darrowii]
MSSFFKTPSHSSTPKSADPHPIYDDLFGGEVYNRKEPEIRITCQRRPPNPANSNTSCPLASLSIITNEVVTPGAGIVDVSNFVHSFPTQSQPSESDAGPVGEVLPKRPDLEDLSSKTVPSSSRKVLNKKRSYAQFHLELGQSDFLLHTCTTCGFKYAAGDEGDEKVHKNCTHGIQFKVQEVVKMMAMDLGEEWIFRKHCKVYLFLESQRIAGCLVAEQIKKAYKILSSSKGGGGHRSTGTKDAKPNPTTLQFGEVVFQREVTRKATSDTSYKVLEANLSGAILCEEEAVPASCGI